MNKHLRRLFLGDVPAPAKGTPLLEVGDPANAEVEVELLTSDALRVAEGGVVEIEVRGILHPGTIRRIEPSGKPMANS